MLSKLEFHSYEKLLVSKLLAYCSCPVIHFMSEVKPVWWCRNCNLCTFMNSNYVETIKIWFVRFEIEIKIFILLRTLKVGEFPTFCLQHCFPHLILVVKYYIFRHLFSPSIPVLRTLPCWKYAAFHSEPEKNVYFPDPLSGFVPWIYVLLHCRLIKCS